MSGTRYPNYGGEGRRASDSQACVTRLLNWLEAGRVSHVLFHLRIGDNACGDVILCRTEWVIQAEALVKRESADGSSWALDLAAQSWLLVERHRERARVQFDPLPSRWWLLSVAEDLLSAAPQELVEEMQDRRAMAVLAAGLRSRTVT